MHGGAIPGSIASLLIRVRDNQVQVTMTNRQVPIDRIDDRVLRSWTRSNEGKRRRMNPASDGSAPRTDLFSPAPSMVLLIAWPTAALLTAALLITRRDA